MVGSFPRTIGLSHITKVMSSWTEKSSGRVKFGFLGNGKDVEAFRRIAVYCLQHCLRLGYAFIELLKPRS